MACLICCCPEVVRAVPTLSIKRPGSRRLVSPSLCSAVLALVLIASFTSVLRAQSTNASVAGRVTDPSKAVLVAAKVTAISTDTNIRYEGMTNEAADYYLTNLPPGTYRLEIEKSGFKKLIKPEVTLHVQDTLKIEFEMELGSASESITVESAAPAVNTESAAVSTVIDRTFVENTSLDGRNYQTSLMVTMGAVVTAMAFDYQGQFSVNGQLAAGKHLGRPGEHAYWQSVCGQYALRRVVEL